LLERAGERNRTAVISLEGTCQPGGFKAYSDNTAFFAPIEAKRLIGAVRMAAHHYGTRMSALDPKRTVRAYYRSGIDLAKAHNAVGANNKARLNFDLII
jgi:hypothetical protein